MTDLPLIISPSILSADFSRLHEEIISIEQYADAIHVDVMDGHFVENLSFGAPVTKWIQTSLPLDVHLMVSNPEDRIEEFLELGVRNITFHGEVTDHEEREALVSAIRNEGATAGIAINPATPLDTVEDVLGDIDLLLVMSVVPGFGGQAFMPEVLEKVSAARTRYPHLTIQMDGGVDDQTAIQCKEAGANNLVAGSYIFGTGDRAEAIAALR